MRGLSQLAVSSALLLLLSAVPVGSAGPTAVILHEGADDGVTYGDNLNRLGWALLDDDGAPIVHRDAAFEVTYRGVPLFATDRASGHDYDGIGRYFVAFPGPGDYSVAVTVPTADGDATATMNGTIDGRTAGPAKIDWDPPARATVHEATTFHYAVIDADGDPIPHAQVLFEVIHTGRDTRVFSVDTHAHGPAPTNGQEGEHAHDGDAHHSLDYVFEEAGEHIVRLTAYHAHPTDRVVAFAAFTTQHTITVDSGPLPAVPVLPTFDLAPPLENRVDEGEAEGPYRIFASYDPYTSTGVGGKIRLATTVVDTATGRPVQHLDHHARIIGPDGSTLFASDSLHSYDGIFEIMTSHGSVGEHTLIVEATSTRIDWHGTATFRYTIHPPAVTTSLGPHFVDVLGTEDIVAGQPHDFRVRVQDLAGQPFSHSEVHLRVTEDATGRLILDGKLHTHADGRFPFLLTLPRPGDYTLHVDPYALTPAPPTPFHGPTLNEGRSFPFTVVGDPDPFALLETLPEDDAAAGIPGPGVPLFLCLVLFASWLRRPRRE